MFCFSRYILLTSNRGNLFRLNGTPCSFLRQVVQLQHGLGHVIRFLTGNFDQSDLNNIKLLSENHIKLI